MSAIAWKAMSKPVSHFVLLALVCGGLAAQGSYTITFEADDLADNVGTQWGPFSSQQLRELVFRVDGRVPAGKFREIRDVLTIIYEEVGVRFDPRQIRHGGTSQWGPNEDGVIWFRLTDQRQDGYAACGWWSGWPTGGRVLQFGNSRRAMDRVVIAHELGHCLFRMRHIHHSDYMMCSGSNCSKTELWTTGRNLIRPWHRHESRLMQELVSLQDEGEREGPNGGHGPDDPGDDTPVDDMPPPCEPTKDVLDLDGYRVRMCYVTPNGAVGQAKAGIYSSGQSGLLWFFDRDNAEVLVKVLNGCAVNSHRWVYVAPVTDLAVHMTITSPSGEEWSYVNESSVKADTMADASAFQCD